MMALLKLTHHKMVEYPQKKKGLVFEKRIMRGRQQSITGP